MCVVTRRAAQLNVRKGQIIAATPRAFGEDFQVLCFGGAERPAYEICGDYATVDVCGPLVQHEHFILDNYDSIRERVAKALASDAPKVALRIDSPGGDFQGSLELARELRGMANAAGKMLCAFVDSNALSAAYAIASACNEIVVTETAMVGSVGVWAPLVDETALDRAMGRNIAIIASGPNKAERNPHVSMTESAVMNLQGQVDKMAGMFFSLVREHRGVAEEVLMKLGGRELMASDAVSLGLADYVVPSWNAFVMGGAAASVISSEGKGNSMAAAKKSLKATLAEYAEGEDKDEAKRASKMLADMYKEAAKGDGDEPDGDEKAKGDGEPEKKDEKEAKASAEDEKKALAAADDDADKKAQGRGGLRAVASASELTMAERLHALETQVALDKENDTRTKLLAGRPDFSKEIRATLETAPIDFVKKACSTWPRVANAMAASVNALTPGGTRGDTQVDGREPSKMVNHGGREVSEGDYIDQKMGLSIQGSGITHSGNTLELGFMTPAQASEHLAKLEAKKGSK